MGRLLVLAWFFVGVVVLSAQARQSSNGDGFSRSDQNAAVQAAHLSALTERVSRIEDQYRDGKVLERLVALEVVATRAMQNQTLLYSVLAGVAIQLIVSALGLKKAR